MLGVNLGENVEKGNAVSPVHFVTSDNPPILIMHGTADAQVPFAQSVELADALRKAGVSVTFQKFPGAGHGGAAFHLPAVRDLIERFFDKNLKGLDVKIEPLPVSEVTAPAPDAKPK